MPRNIVHIIGTGTIGDPLIGILAGRREKLGIDEVTFQPNVESLRNKSLVKGLITRGAKLCVDEADVDAYTSAGLKVEYSVREAIERSGVVIDCSNEPDSGVRKLENYRRLNDGEKLFIVQSRVGKFGKDYAFNINDDALKSGEDKYLRVVSCNSQNMAAILKTLIFDANHKSLLDWGRFLCIRRTNDISEEEDFVPSPQVGIHKDDHYGTYQARDAANLFKTIGTDLDLYCSSLKVNSQYLHILYFDLKLTEDISLQQVLNRLDSEPLIALTNKRMASTVFSFIREMGYHSRILNQSIVCVPSLQVKDRNEISGFSFSPQDGNSVMSSIAAALWQFYPKTYRNKMEQLNDLVFKEV